MTRKGWCKCGAAFRVTSSNEPMVLRIERAFWETHDGAAVSHWRGSE
jgi:hypothetical protein